MFAQTSEHIKVYFYHSVPLVKQTFYLSQYHNILFMCYLYGKEQEVIY